MLAMFKVVKVPFTTTITTTTPPKHKQMNQPNKPHSKRNSALGPETHRAGVSFSDESHC